MGFTCTCSEKSQMHLDRFPIMRSWYWSGFDCCLGIFKGTSTFSRPKQEDEWYDLRLVVFLS